MQTNETSEEFVKELDLVQYSNFFVSYHRLFSVEYIDLCNDMDV